MTSPRLALSLASANGDSRSQDSSEGLEMSCGMFFQGRRFALDEYQRQFPDDVARYINGTRLSDGELAYMFGKSERTIRNWRAGIVGASGAVIALIATADPEGFARHFDPLGRVA